jgi:hypothetical protein
MPKFILSPTPVTSARPVPAIKAVREVTGFGLKESKDVVDQMNASHQVFTAELSPNSRFRAAEDAAEHLRKEGGFDVQTVQDPPPPPLNHKAEAEKHLQIFAIELVTANKYEAAMNETNLLSLLMKVEE